MSGRQVALAIAGGRVALGLGAMLATERTLTVLGFDPSDAGGRTLTQVHDGQSGYLSQSALPLYFGLGDATVIDQVSVQWLAGQQQVLKGPIETNRPLVIVEGESAPR